MNLYKSYLCNTRRIRIIHEINAKQDNKEQKKKKCMMKRHGRSFDIHSTIVEQLFE